MATKNELLYDLSIKLHKAIGHLAYSYAKVKNLPKKADELDEESLETWESFSARFARVTDIFVSKYLRTLVAQEEPGFRGSLRDLLLVGEKLGVITSAQTWAEIKELRNATAHEYNDEAFEAYITRLYQLTPVVLSVEKVIKKCA